ncbi:MAG: hypothetical protein WBW92_00725, partial [Rhodanobacteraceae bacterium]
MACSCATASAGSVTVPNTFQPNTPAVAASVNENFDAVAVGVNGNAVDISNNASDIAALQSALATLQSQVSTLQGTVSSQAATITSLQSQLTAVQGNTVLTLDNKLGLGTDNATGQPTARFTGVNVQVVDGTGSTDGVPNGLGNLIIGYNETAGTRAFCSDGLYDNQGDCQTNGGTWAANQRSGSHNLILGDRNAYSRYGGLVAGTDNVVNGAYASVSGGYFNTASGSASSVSGGASSIASGSFSSVSGGHGNTASGNSSSVSGGYGNTASVYYSSVSGGISNAASGYYSSVSGGHSNT